MNFAKCQGEGGGGSGARLHRTPTRAVLNGEVSPLHSSYERGCQEKKLLPAPGEDAGVVTYIQPHLILRGVIGLAALARRTF